MDFQIYFQSPNQNILGATHLQALSSTELQAGDFWSTEQVWEGYPGQVPSLLCMAGHQGEVGVVVAGKDVGVSA